MMLQACFRQAWHVQVVLVFDSLAGLYIGSGQVLLQQVFASAGFCFSRFFMVVKAYQFVSFSLCSSLVLNCVVLFVYVSYLCLPKA